jgi:preprotein translocase subunit SecB
MTEATQDQPVFNIDKLYVKDLSLEIPHAPQIFLERENPQIEVQLHTSSNTIDEGVFEVNVTATVTSKVGEKVMFLIEAKQAGIFTIRNLPATETEPVLGVMCPNILFPYLREVVSDVAVRAGFAPVMLNPINFEVLYQQQQQAEATKATTH